jgi:MtN3 and saliva related transmembrane protein
LGVIDSRFAWRRFEALILIVTTPKEQRRPNCILGGMNTLIGLFAAFCTTASYVPQLKKCWDTGSAGDLSLKMFLILTIGIAAWVFYGFLQKDMVIVIANSVSLCLLFGILYFKVREHKVIRGLMSGGDGWPIGD